MASRSRFTSGSPPPVSGPSVLDNTDGHLGTIYNFLPLEMTVTSGVEANDLTVTLDPPLDVAGLIKGMSFWLEPLQDNTDAMTISIDGTAAVPVLQNEGAGVTAGQIKAVGRYLLSYDGSDLIVMNHLTTTATASGQVDIFTGDGTLTKPDGFPDGGLVYVEAWGGGGGGAYQSTIDTASSRGVGGAYVQQIFRGVDFASSESVIIGQGGAGGINGGATAEQGETGGDTLIGGFFVCPGGRGADKPDTPPGSEPGSLVAYKAGGNGGVGSEPGGTSIYGGDGGAGSNGSVGGSGAAPAGGGGAGSTGGVGARGELRVTWQA